MKIYGISDNHGKLDFTIPKCDLLLHAGDISLWYKHWSVARQLKWFSTELAEWLEAVPAERIILIPGNHDFICEKNLAEANKKMPAKAKIIHDERVEYNGLVIWGTAWQPTACNWAFNCSDTDSKLYDYFRKIPNDTDILLTHCPPKGYCDEVSGPMGPISLGSASLMTRMWELQPNPMINVCGHIHNGRGFSRLGQTEVYNVSLVDEDRNLVYEPMEIEL